MSDLAMVDIFEAGKPWSAMRKDAVLARIDDRLGDLAAALGDRDWLDETFSVGDLVMVTVLRQLRGSDILDRHPRLSRYRSRGEARPAFQRALAGQMQGFTGAPPPGFGAPADRETTT